MQIPIKFMIKQNIKICFLSINLAALLGTGCKEIIADPFGSVANLSIEEIDATGTNSITVRIVPSEDVKEFRFAIGNNNDYTSFVSDNMDNMQYREGSTPVEYTFDGLIPDSTYTVFAVASDENGLEGEIASIKVSTYPDDISISMQYVLDRSAGFTINMPSDYYRCRYYIGKASDREDFINGTIAGESNEDFIKYTVNCFGLEPSTDYVFYLEPFFRSGVKGNLIETKIKTVDDGSCPSANLEFVNDIYQGEYNLFPNDKCSKITSFICAKGEKDEVINSRAHWKGDLLSMMTSWEELADFGYVTIATDGDPVILNMVTPDLLCGYNIEIYAMLYGMDGNIVGIQHFDVSTPKFDDDAPEATVSISITDITEKGATYSYKKGKGTFALFYDTIDADWFDDFKENDPSYHSYYIHELMLSEAKNWSYGSEDVIFTENKGVSSHRYYAAGCPMNHNGPQGGWGELVLKEYVTL